MTGEQALMLIAAINFGFAAARIDIRFNFGWAGAMWAALAVAVHWNG